MNNYFTKNNLKIVIILINLIHNLKLRKKIRFFFIIPLELHNTTECLDKCYKHGLITKEILINCCDAISSR